MYMCIYIIVYNVEKCIYVCMCVCTCRGTHVHLIQLGNNRCVEYFLVIFTQQAVSGVWPLGTNILYALLLLLLYTYTYIQCVVSCIVQRYTMITNSP